MIVFIFSTSQYSRNDTISPDFLFCDDRLPVLCFSVFVLCSVFENNDRTEV